MLFPDSSDKAARFIWICNAFNIPLLFLVDIAGYMIGSEVERQGIIRHGAKMLFAVADSRVPRITVLRAQGLRRRLPGDVRCPDAAGRGHRPADREACAHGPGRGGERHPLQPIQSIEDPEERAAFIAEKQDEYAAGIDVFKIANENAVEAVVPANELRGELTNRLALYRKRDRTAPARRNGVTPV